MLQKTNAVSVRTIGIDTSKNTFHLIGLDQQGTMIMPRTSRSSSKRVSFAVRQFQISCDASSSCAVSR